MIEVLLYSLMIMVLFWSVMMSYSSVSLLIPILWLGNLDVSVIKSTYLFLTGSKVGIKVVLQSIASVNLLIKKKSSTRYDDRCLRFSS